jgi:hypothetical protein
MPSIGQTWVLASIRAVEEIGVLSTLKRLPKESNLQLSRCCFPNTGFFVSEISETSADIIEMLSELPINEFGLDVGPERQTLMVSEKEVTLQLLN